MIARRRTLLLLWLLPPVAVVILHFAAAGPWQQMDRIGDDLAEARRLTGEGNWGQAVTVYGRALAAVPNDRVTLRREIQLEQSQAMMNASRLPDAHRNLKELLDEILADESVSAEFENRVRESLANSQFYMTWLMRLEGLARTEWEPEIESARQNYRLLAERAEQAGDGQASQSQRQNLESSIRLARLDLTDLQGLPLPSQ